MKKALPVILCVVVLAAVGFFLMKRGAMPVGQGVEPAALADAATVVYLELGDLPGTAERWSATALAAIAAEPDVQAFLEQPMSKLRERLQASPMLGPLTPLQIRSAFIAVSKVDQQVPTVLAGLRHSAGKEELDAALAPARNHLLEQFPNGKADLLSIEGIHVETYTTPDWKMAAANHSGWFLISNDLDALEQAIRRLKVRPEAAPALKDSPKFQEVVAKLPPRRESLVYLDAPPVIQKLGELALAAGQPISSAQQEEMKALQSLGATTSFDGAEIRDVIFVKMDMSSMPKGALSAEYPLTSSRTLFYFASMLDWPESFSMPADARGVDTLAPLAAILERLEAKGLGASAFSRAFGETFSFSLDWAGGQDKVGFHAAADVADRATAESILAELASGSVGIPVFSREQASDGSTLYVLPPLPRVPFRPAIGLDDKRLLLASSPEEVRSKLALKAPADNALSASPEFNAALAKVSQPTHSFAYLDAKPAFEHTYTMLRPTLVFASGLMPGVNETLDLSKLPPPEAIANHLSPIIFSESHHGDGVLYESVGPVTIPQGLSLGGVAAILAAVWAQAFFQ